MNPIQELEFKGSFIFNLKKILPWISIFLSVIIHLILLFKYSINFPFEDDHRLFLEFFSDFVHSPNFEAKLRGLFSQENESRPFLMRVILLLISTITGNLNFNILLFVSNIYTLLMLYVFVKKYNFDLYILAIVTLSIMNLSAWEMYFRNDVAAYQNSTIALSIWLIYFISSPKNKQKNSLFYFVYFITPFGSGIGFLTIFICLMYSFIRKINLNKVVLSLIFLAQIIIFFFLNTKTNQVKESVFEKIVKYNFELINALMIAISGQFNLTANSFGLIFSGFFGLIFILVSMYFFFLEFNNSKYDFEKLVLLFAFLSILLIVISRYNYWIIGYESVLCARYKIYGGLILATLSSYFLAKTKYVKLKIISLIFFIFFYGFWFLKNESQLSIKKNMQLEDAYNLENSMVNHENGRMKFVPELKYEYLKNNSYFSPIKTLQGINKYLNGAKKYIPSNSNLNTVNNDPSFNSDFGIKNNRLIKLSLEGNFGNSSTYFVKIIDKNNKTMILNLFEKPNSFYKRILFEKKEVLELSRDFNLEFYKISPPYKFEIYGIN